MSVRRIDFLDEDGVLACLTGDDTDLDDALLAILVAESQRDDSWDWEEDGPTRITHGCFHWRGEVEVGRFRKAPCACGNEHGWDLQTLGEDYSRGTFWGVLA